MLALLGHASLDALADAAVPAHIRREAMLRLPAALGESAALAELRAIAAKNKIFRSFIGLGYHDTATPGVIQRNILENPGWYTAYTPYQAEISQGRLEALLNFQTLVTDLTGLEIANASMLDEGTAAAEAMMMCHRVKLGDSADQHRSSSPTACHPQTIDIVRTRAKPLGIDVVTGDHRTFDFTGPVFGVLVQYPDTTGSIHDLRAFFAQGPRRRRASPSSPPICSRSRSSAPPANSAPMSPSAPPNASACRWASAARTPGFLATKDEFKRQMPGRLVGVSKDVHGDPAMRLALGTREQHIRRDKATSNICTAQVLLAVMASMYAVYHGPEGLKRIASAASNCSRSSSPRGLAPRRQGQRRARLRHPHRRNVAAERVHAAASPRSSTCAPSTPTPSASRSTKPPPSKNHHAPLLLQRVREH
jgi:glycine dehydrogenase